MRYAGLLMAGVLAVGGCPLAVSAQATPVARANPADPYVGFVTEASQRFGIPEHWIRAVLRAESAGDVRAVSSAGAMGLMQVMPDTWAGLRVRYRLGRDPYEPRDNIMAGAASGERLVGFDNAHPVGRGRRGEPLDHRHRLQTVRPYAYKDAATLLADFWQAVDAVLKERGVI